MLDKTSLNFYLLKFPLKKEKNGKKNLIIEYIFYFIPRFIYLIASEYYVIQLSIVIYILQSHFLILVENPIIVA